MDIFTDCTLLVQSPCKQVDYLCVQQSVTNSGNYFEFQVEIHQVKRQPRRSFSWGICNSTVLSFWFSGPQFLHNPSVDLNSFDNFPSVKSVSEERKVALISTTILLSEEFWSNLFTRFPSFNHLQRALAYVLRLCQNSRANSEKRSLRSLDHSRTWQHIYTCNQKYSSPTLF